MNDDILKKNIIELLGLENLPKEKQDALIQQMSGVVQSRIARRIDASLTDDQKEQFNKLTEAGADEAKINEFLKSNVKSFDEIVTDEIMQFKQDMVSEVETLKQAFSQ